MTTTTKKTVFITGSTRGIGLAFAETYIKAGWNVIGTARANSNTSSPLSDEATVIEAARQLEGQPIDLLINNAALGLSGGLATTKDSIMHQFEVNAVGPFLKTRALLPNLRLAAKHHGTASVVQLSSVVGSIGSLTNESDPMLKDAVYGYGTSKAALNMITRALSVELSASNIVVVSVHPGHVVTALSQNTGPLKPVESATAISEFVNQLKLENTGKFFNLDPLTPVTELPW